MGRRKLKEYPELSGVIEDVLKDNAGDMHDEIELGYFLDVEYQKGENAPGFIPFTDGGWNATAFIPLSFITFTGLYPSSTRADEAIERMEEFNREVARERFMEENPDIVDIVGEDNIGYHRLMDLGYEKYAKELDMYVDEYFTEDSIMYQLGIWFYDIENRENEYYGEYHSVWVYGLINWESPYHRAGRDNEWVAPSSDLLPIYDEYWDDLSRFESVLSRKVREILDEF